MHQPADNDKKQRIIVNIMNISVDLVHHVSCGTWGTNCPPSLTLCVQKNFGG
uniref:Uncharacterized protein n=1 Tax=Arion vulgaris TaxID=1028688 RepID=A0A0B7BLL4_9EUPU